MHFVSIFLVGVLINLVNCGTQVSSFKKNVMSYVSQVELPPYAERTLMFDLEEDFKNCTVMVEYFPRFHFDTEMEDTLLKSTVTIESPKEKMFHGKFKLGTKESTQPLQKNLKFTDIGVHKIIMTNLEGQPIIGSILLDMVGCHTHNDMHAGQDEMNGVIDKVEKIIWK